MGKKKAEGKNKGGRPTSYRPEFCERLVQHMAKGMSFESFAAVIGHHRSSLYEWAEEHPEFSDAKRKGLDASLIFWETAAQNGTLGRLRRIASEEPVLDAQSKPIYDAKGEMVKKITYAPATFSAGAFCFIMKNMHGWRDRIDLRTGEIPASDDLSGKTMGELAEMAENLRTEIKKAAGK